jgi:hypothetical protein
MAASWQSCVYIFKLRAASCKPQATSGKPRAASFKLQAASDKLSNIFSLVKFPVASSERLYPSAFMNLSSACLNNFPCILWDIIQSPIRYPIALYGTLPYMSIYGFTKETYRNANQICSTACNQRR